MASHSKRSSSARREESQRNEKVPKFNSASDGWLELDVSSPGVASSSQGPPAGPVEKRVLSDARDDEAPEKLHNKSSVGVGYGASDKIGEVPCQREYEEDPKKFAEEYQVRNSSGECFVHL